jgi:predicted DNA-binding protein (MmcQ/YjbR family)
MHIEQLRDYCLSLKGVTEELPFGPTTLVFKVMGKMFALVPLDIEDLRVSLKNTPEENQALRAMYPFIEGAFHMSKTHWNTLRIGFEVKDELVCRLIAESYHLVVAGLTKKLKAELDQLD